MKKRYRERERREKEKEREKRKREINGEKEILIKKEISKKINR